MRVPEGPLAEANAPMCSVCHVPMRYYPHNPEGNADAAPAWACNGAYGEPSHSWVWRWAMYQHNPAELLEHDPVNHPSHYTQHPSGVECIDIVEWMTFNRGCAVKYIWRAGDKGDEIEDLRKSVWYLNREIERLEKLRA